MFAIMPDGKVLGQQEVIVNRNCQRLYDRFKKMDVSMSGSMPAVIYIESVKGCPYSCAMCSIHNSKPVLIKKELLKKLEPYFKRLEVLSIHGSGEPLLGDIPYFVEQSIKNEFVLHMNSTGFFLTKELSDMLLKTRLSIRFSIHAGSAETYKRIMGHSFERVVNNVKYIVNKSIEYNTDNDYWFSFIAMKANIDEIEDFLHVAHTCGIRSVRFMRLMYTKGRNISERNFKFDYFEQNEKEIRRTFLERLPRYKDLAERLGIKIQAGTMTSAAISINTIGEFINMVTGRLLPEAKLFPIKAKKGVCIMPWFGQLIIGQDGNVNLCCGTAYSLGNLNDYSLEDIWDSQKMKVIRRSFSKKRYPKVCGYCHARGLSEYPSNAFTNLER